MILENPNKKNWGFLVYIAGDNNLSDAGLEDIRELCQVGATPQTHVGVEIDTYGEHTGSIRYEISEKDYSGQAHRIVIDRLAEKDSLVNYISGVLYDTYGFLNQQGEPSLSALLAAGIWAEGLYIATHISDDTFNNYDIVKIIYDQKNSLGKVIELMKKFEGSDLIDGLLKSFGELKQMYDETGTSLTKEQLNKITATIKTIRSSIIS